MSKKLTKSLEKYLYAIGELSVTTNSIKVKDVANYLAIGGPSTAEAVKTLSKKGYINYKPYQTIILTKEGVKKFNQKKSRLTTISKFFNTILNIEYDLSLSTAENIEFTMPDNVLEKFVNYLNFTDRCSCKNPHWMESCKKTLDTGFLSGKCQLCITNKEKLCCCGGETNE